MNTLLRSSHPADLAAAIRRHRRPATLARMTEQELWRQVQELAGAPLARGGRLHLSYQRIMRTLAVLRRPAPARQRCRRCGGNIMPVCTACRRPCGTLSEGWIYLRSACHPRSCAACPRCWTPPPRRRRGRPQRR